MNFRTIIEPFRIKSVESVKFTRREKDFGPVFGFKTEVFTSSNFSWKLDVRDTMTINHYANIVVFSLNMGLNF